ncbi:sigma-70 family RNA polymerase sigma factor [Listeria welshimeri]|nr:sigma-70 family RNA polymerase sigma factor [Listeria welshimeri]
MKPEDFENAVRLQFDCLARKVIGRTVKNYNKELGRRAKREIPFCEIPEPEVEKMGFVEEYPNDFTTFDVFGTKVRVYDERLCEAILQLNEQRRNILLMSYFLEIPDIQISEILEIARSSVYRNRMQTLKLIRDMYEEGELE